MPGKPEHPARGGRPAIAAALLRGLYSVLLVILAPFLLLWMGWRAHRAGGQWGVLSAPRLGRFTDDTVAPGAVWVHAVSLGETRAAQPLVQALLARGHRVLLTHLTATGWAEGQRAHAAALSRGQLRQAWLPYDFPGAVRRFLQHYAPAAGVLMERELWPNLVHAASSAHVPLVLASARMSERSLRQAVYLAWLMRPVYAALAHVWAQSAVDARRLSQAGARTVGISGNFKFDVHPDEGRVARGRTFAAALGRPVVVIASTREGEDALFVDAIRLTVQAWCGQAGRAAVAPLFVLIPRHPQRFDDAARRIAAAGLSFVRRSQWPDEGTDAAGAVQACRGVDVLLGDTLGEMPWYYACAQVAIVAGSFAPLGGQNFIEASAVGCPVLVGPHVEHFEQAAADALQAGAIVQVPSAAAAVHQAVAWLEDDGLRRRMRAAADAWVGQHRGAVARVLDCVEALLPPS